MPVDAALSRTLAGRALAQAGQSEPAVGQLSQAAGHLDACGAIRYRAAAEFELRRLGRRVHRRTQRGDGHRYACAVVHRSRTSDCPARRGPQDEPVDRRSTLPQSQDRRNTPAQPVPQARCLLTRRCGTGHRAIRRAEGPMKVMATVVPLAGHVGPVSGLVAELINRGHQVRVYTGSRYRQRFADLGATVVPWSNAQDFDEENLGATFPLARRRGPTVIALVRQGFIGTAPGQVQDLAQSWTANLLTSWSPTR